mmetsp:Transcript_6559/g.16221  ORF Transcript_6559/g.16221 Transcript_6559/m.16221 type:complete len:394 (-) Transcript_6559:130-1311(-)
MLLRVGAPRQHREPIEVGSRHVELRARRLETLQLEQLLVDHLLHRLGHLDAGDPLGELGGERLLVVALEAELLLDQLELLHQHVPPLVGAHLVLDVLADLRLELRELELLLEQQQRLLDPAHHVERAEHLLQRLRVGRRERRTEVGEPACLMHLRPLEDHLHLLLEERVELEDLLDRLHHLHRVRLRDGLGGAVGLAFVRCLLHPDLEHRAAAARRLDDLVDLDAPAAHEQHLRAVRRGREPHDLGERAHLVQLGRVVDGHDVLAAFRLAGLALVLGKEDAHVRVVARLGRGERGDQPRVDDLARLEDPREDRPGGEREDSHGRHRADVIGVVLLQSPLSLVVQLHVGVRVSIGLGHCRRWLLLAAITASVTTASSIAAAAAAQGHAECARGQ